MSYVLYEVEVGGVFGKVDVSKDRVIGAPRYWRWMIGKPWDSVRQWNEITKITEVSRDETSNHR